MDVLSQQPIRATFLAHLLLTTWALHDVWLPSSYLFYNIFFLLSLMWALHAREHDEPVLIAGLIDLGSIIMDIVTLAAYYSYSASAGFSIFMCIANLLLRPLTVLLLMKAYNDRNGRYSNYGFGTFATGGGGPFGFGGDPTPDDLLIDRRGGGGGPAGGGGVGGYQARASYQDLDSDNQPSTPIGGGGGGGGGGRGGSESLKFIGDDDGPPMPPTVNLGNQSVPSPIRVHGGGSGRTRGGGG